MEWFKKHADSVAVMGSIIIATAWMLTSIHGLKSEVDARLHIIEKDMAIIKTVLVMKEMMPKELASNVQTQ